MQNSESPSEAPPRARVLLADDDPRVRELIGNVLEGYGFGVTRAADGMEAIEIAKRHPPDLALIDLDMPKLNGFCVIERLKSERGASLPILVLSGSLDADERVRAFDVGADDFVPKPVHMRELLRRVDAFERARRAYLRLQEANERADHLRVFAHEAAGLLAHDLNNGLTIASANLEFLESEMTVLSSDREFLDAMTSSRRALRRMIGLVQNFVDVTRLEDAALTPTRVPTDVLELAESAAAIHQRFGEGEAKIQIRVPAGLSATIDPTLIERILHNLLNNATRYVNRGGSVVVDAEINGSVLLLGVGNSGAVISGELRNNLFNKYQVGKDGHVQYGMGLYFCRLAAEAHGGRISLADRDGFGTYFLVELPLA